MMHIATEDQKRRAREVVAATLGTYALTTKPDDPAAAFGYECALAAIVQADDDRDEEIEIPAGLRLATGADAERAARVRGQMLAAMDADLAAISHELDEADFPRVTLEHSESDA